MHNQRDILATMPKVLIASDHAGFALKDALVERIRALGYDVEDMGPSSYDGNDDYPDFMTPLAKRIAASPETRGVIIGGSGQAEAMCANRVPGARAAVFCGPRSVTSVLDIEGDRSEDGYDIVRLPRLHNDANILSIGARFVSEEEANEAVRIFLETPFSGNERHIRRLAKF
jgi:ribose 5-phosphate isomerase B